MNVFEKYINEQNNDVIDNIVKKLSKSGWGGTNKNNLESVIERIIYDYKKMDDQLKSIRKIVY